MTSPHGAVAKPEYGVEMQAGLAVVALRNVADQAQYFALLIDGNRTVSPGSEIEPTDLRALERSDRRDRCRANGLLVGKGADSRKSLFVLIQNQNKSPSVVFGSQFGFHEPPRGKDDRVSCDWSNSARSTLGYSPGSSWCNHLLPSWRASLLKTVSVGRRIKRYAANAERAQPTEQAQRRQIGEHCDHQTASEHDRGQNQRRSNKHGCPFDGDGLVLGRSLLVPQPVKEMHSAAETQSEGDRQRHDACELQALPDQPPQRTREYERKYSRHDAG